MIESQGVNVLVSKCAPLIPFEAAIRQFDFLSLTVVTYLGCAGIVWIYNGSVPFVIVGLLSELDAAICCVGDLSVSFFDVAYLLISYLKKSGHLIFHLVTNSCCKLPIPTN